ncbi:MAG: tRNA pseudouridine(13) synthase TruD, partial [Candidatus Woesearchaeota archaeon]
DYKKATEYLCEGSDIYSDSIRVYLTAYPNDYISALKKIPRKTLLMFTHAVQSYIFNEALSKILIEAQSSKYTENISNSDDIGRYSIKYSMGEFVFLRDAKDYANLEGTESLELVGFDTKNMNHHIKHVLEAAGISLRDFVVKALPELSVEGAIRECFVEVQNIDVRMLDDRAILEFELPKGSYATIVVKALFSN